MCEMRQRCALVCASVYAVEYALVVIVYPLILFLYLKIQIKSN